MSEMPGPDEDVIALAPAQPAPIAMPTAAISSSAWITAIFRSPVAESRRKRSAYAISASQREDEGVIGYHASTVQPPMIAPSAAAWLPSRSTCPSVTPDIDS